MINRAPKAVAALLSAFLAVGIASAEGGTNVNDNNNNNTNVNDNENNNTSESNSSSSSSSSSTATGGRADANATGGSVGDTTSTSGVEGSGNSANTVTTNPTATTNGTNQQYDQSVTNYKHEAAPNNVAPTILPGGTCQTSYAFGASVVSGAGVGFGKGKTDRKCLDQVQRHEETLTKLKSGDPTLQGNALLEGATRDANKRAALNATAETARRSQGPSLADFVRAIDPSVVNAAAAEANRATGRDVRVSTPAPSFGGDR